MRKYLVKISSLILAVLVICTGLVGCNLEDWLLGDNSPEPEIPELKTLDTPQVAIGVDGVAVWGKINYALYYAYVIDESDEMLTVDCSVQLEENQTIKVKAISGNENYRNSDFSAPKTYIKGDTTDHEHSDVNSDNLCDICGDSVLVELSFYAVNDLHGKFLDTDSQPGVDEFTTYLKNLYADDTREEIVLSSGDMWQGTVESSSNKGQLMTEWMSEVGFVSMTLGNHEFDWGADILTPNSQLAKFPFLAINVKQNGKNVDYCQASTVVEKSGVKIGIIGAIGDCLSSISGDFTDGLSFETKNALTSLVKNEAQRLRNEVGCDFIVYSIHDGGDGFSTSGTNYVTNSDMPWYDSSLSDGYIDLVFEGHTHQRYILRDEYGVYHLQGGGENKYISSAEVSYNIVTDDYTVKPRLIGSGEYASSSLAGDPVVEEIFNQYFPDSNPYTDVLGYNASKKNSDAILSQLAKLYFDKGLKEWGSSFDIVLGGGYLNVRSPYQIEKGNVTYADVFSILPFDNEIVLGRVNGSSLKNILSRDNYTVYSKISSSEIVNSKTYYIIVDSYSSTYKYNNITEIARLGSGTYPRDLLAEYLKSGGWA